MMRRFPVLVPVAVSMVLVAGCSPGGADDAVPSLTVTSATPTMDGGTCPEAEPAADTPATWKVTGATGSVSIAASTDTAGPLINVTTPLSVVETQVQTLSPGRGAEITDDSIVNVCYEGVDGRDGQVFDSSYQRGRPSRIRVDSVVPGFRRALVGQRVGADVAVVMTADDGYPDGTPDGTIKPGDSIVFVLKVTAAEPGSTSAR